MIMKMINVKFYGILRKTLGRRKYYSKEELLAFLSATIYETNISYDQKTDIYHVSPRIAGSGGGGKGSPPPVPLLQPPTAGQNVLQSFSQMEVVDLICEGPIQGFCDADGNEIDIKKVSDPAATIAQGVFLNNTIVQNPNNTFNFRRLSLNSSVGDANGISRMAWARSKIYRTVDINRALVGPNMRTDSASSVDAGAKKYNMDGQTGANYRNNFGNAIGWYLGDATSTELSKKYGYTHSSLQYGSDIRTNTETRDFTSWSPGQANYNEGAFPVTHTISNSEVDYAYATISVDGLSDTVDHGSGAGKSGKISSAKEHRVGFEIQIGVNGITDEEAKSEEFRAWLLKHGVTQDEDKPRLSVTRNYYIEGLVQGGAYLVDVGRAPWGTDFGQFSDGYKLKDLSETPADGSTENLPEAGRVEDVAAGSAGDATQFDTDADYSGGHGLNKYRQFGYKGANDASMRDNFEDALQTAYIDPNDNSASSESSAVGAASSYDCFELPPCVQSTNFKTRYIKVTKLGREVISPLLNNSITLKNVTEIIDEKLSMPFSAVIQQSFNSRYFNGIPSRTYHLKLKKILIPSNYFPEKRLPSAPRSSASDKTYNGDWDGTFKEAWSDNPAWIFYDLLINNRYGLGSHVDVHKIDKWTLYKIGRYCDAVDEEGYFVGVDDTYGNNQKEPRYTCNVMITNEEESYELLKSISEIFHGIAFWDGRGVSVSMDGGSSSVASTVWQTNQSYAVGDVVESPANSFNFFKCRVAHQNINRKPGIDNNWEEYWDRTPGIETEPPSMAFTNTNVDGGVFSYSNASKSSRFTVARVSYMDKRDDFRKKYEYVEDKQGIKELGIIKKNLEPLGCTSRGQAHRMGRWFFLTSTLNTEIISFATDYRALFLQPGNIIEVNDKLKNKQQKIGKILEISPTDNTVLKLTEEVDIRTTLIDNEDPDAGSKFEIILTSLDPNYSVEYINNSSNFNQGKRSMADIDKLNNSQILRGQIDFPPAGFDSDHIRIKNLENGAYFKFTNKLSSQQEDEKIIPPGTDWALVKPDDGEPHKESWTSREYKVQGISEDEEGKYTVTAVFFDKEKIGSMDQKFAVISPKIDMDVGFSSSPIVDLSSPTISSVEQTESDPSKPIKISVEGTHPPVAGFSQSSMSTELCIYNPAGTKVYTQTVSRGSNEAFSIQFTSSINLNDASAEGIWYAEATTSATNSTTNKTQISVTASMGVSVGNFSFREGAKPEIQNLTVNGVTLFNDFEVQSESDRFVISWDILDIDSESTLITSASDLNLSPFASGIKVGLVALDSGGSEVGEIAWIHGLNSQGAQKSILKSLDYTFIYSERYKTKTASDQNESFLYPNLANHRDIRIKLVPEARAGVDANGETVYIEGTQKNIDIKNSAITYSDTSTGGTLEFVFELPFDSATFMNGTSGAQVKPDGWKKINYLYENEDGDIVQAETDFNGAIPEDVDGAEVAFDYRAEIAKSDVMMGLSGVDGGGRVLSGSAAINIWRTIKNGTRRSLQTSNASTTAPVSHPNDENPVIGLIPIDDMREIAEAEGSPSSKGGVHFYNYQLVIGQIDENITDSEVVEQMGNWETNTRTISNNLDTFTALYDAAYVTSDNQGILVMDRLSIEVAGESGRTHVGYMTVHLCAEKNEVPSDENEVSGTTAPNISIGFDIDGITGLSNQVENGKYIKVRVWDKFNWNKQIGKTIEERKESVVPQTILIMEDYLFYMDESSNFTDLSEDDDSGEIRELKLNMNTYGDERVVGYKQFYNGMIIGGTEEVRWSDGSNIDYNDLDAFTQYPVYNDVVSKSRSSAQEFKGSPVGIGQFDIKGLEGKEFPNLMGDGNSNDIEGMTVATDIRDLKDYHVSIKGMNLTCEAGDQGNYNGSGGLISGEKIHSPSFRAGESIVDLNQLPTIENNSIASKLTGEAEIATFVQNKIQENALPLDGLIQTSFTSNLTISGGAKIGMSGSNFIIQTNDGTIYKITGTVI